MHNYSKISQLHKFVIRMTFLLEKQTIINHFDQLFIAVNNADCCSVIK